MSRSQFKTVLFVLCVLVFTKVGLSDQEGALKNVDFTKVQKDDFTKYIVHLQWPDDVNNSPKKVPREQIKEDFEKFHKVLNAVLKTEYLPDTKVIEANSIAIEGDSDSDDSIFLEYSCKNQKIHIEDSKSLYITFLVPSSEKTFDDVEKYIRDAVYKYMNVPSDEPLKIFMSNKYIGKSKCGSIRVGTGHPGQYWFSTMRWWSDGKNILFGTGKNNIINKIDYSNMAGPPSDINKPRKFMKAIQEDER